MCIRDRYHASLRNRRHSRDDPGHGDVVSPRVARRDFELAPITRHQKRRWERTPAATCPPDRRDPRSRPTTNQPQGLDLPGKTQTPTAHRILNTLHLLSHGVDHSFAAHRARRRGNQRIRGANQGQSQNRAHHLDLWICVKLVSFPQQIYIQRGGCSARSRGRPDYM